MIFFVLLIFTLFILMIFIIMPSFGLYERTQSVSDKGKFRTMAYTHVPCMMALQNSGHFGAKSMCAKNMWLQIFLHVPKCVGAYTHEGLK